MIGVAASFEEFRLLFSLFLKTKILPSGQGRGQRGLCFGWTGADRARANPKADRSPLVSPSDFAPYLPANATRAARSLSARSRARAATFGPRVVRQACPCPHAATRTIAAPLASQQHAAAANKIHGGWRHRSGVREANGATRERRREGTSQEGPGEQFAHSRFSRLRLGEGEG